MSEFLQAVSQGNLNQIREMFSSNQNYIYEKDHLNHNALALAVLSGQWQMAMLLLRRFKVSPHALDINSDSIYHHIAQGFKIKRPTAEDFEDVRAENQEMWLREEQKERARIAEIQQKHPDLRPPEGLFIKTSKDNDAEMFGNIELFFPKYIMNKYHVVLLRKNNLGKTPAEHAKELGEYELAEFYENESKPHMIKRRLIAGLNENLVRDIASFL